MGPIWGDSNLMQILHVYYWLQQVDYYKKSAHSDGRHRTMAFNLDSQIKRQVHQLLILYVLQMTEVELAQVYCN